MRLSEAEQLQAAEMAKAYAAGASGGDLATKYGLSRTKVYGRIKAAGAVMRDRKTSQAMAGPKVSASHALRRAAKATASTEASA